MAVIVGGNPAKVIKELDLSKTTLTITSKHIGYYRERIGRERNAMTASILIPAYNASIFDGDP